MEGWNRVRINSQERAVSTDINRLQAFQHQDVSELLRHLVDTFPSSVDESPGIVSEPSSVETPLRAEVFGGLMVKPQGGSLNLLVDAGTAMVMAPDAAADESNYKLIRDPGVTVVGALVVTSNPAGSARIDVVECRVNPVEAIVTDNRDVFDTTTGGFVATTVTKELKGRFEYRVRAGTAGAGFPGTASGWLPLAVISAPAAAASVDDMTFWDVRPLLADRAEGIASAPREWPMVERANFVAEGYTVATELRLSGQVVARHAGRRLGGILRRGSPGTEANYVDLLATANQASGFAMPASGALYYAYLLTPFGLPRWARYTDGPAGRVPRAPFGILVVSLTAPTHLKGTPSAAISLPSSTGLGSSSTSGLCIASFISTGLSTSGLGQIADDKVAWHRNGLAVSPTASDASSSTFTLIEGTTHPANAKAIYVQMSASVSSAAGNTKMFQVNGFVRAYGPGGLQYESTQGLASFFVNLGVVDNTVSLATGVVRIPMWSQYPTTPGGNKILIWNHTVFIFDAGTSPTILDRTMTVVGWEL